MAEICIISDGKPGHLNQSLGLVEALHRLRPELSWYVRQPLSVSEWPGCLLRPPSSEEKIIIGAGHRTHLSLLLLSRHWGARSVVLMQPSLPMSWFDLCLIPEHDEPPARVNVLTTRGALNRMRPAGKQPKSGMFLIGGPSKHVQWQEDELLQQVTAVMTQDPQRQWSLTTSRRTPDSTLQRLRQIPGLELFSASETGPDWLPQQLTGCEVCWVTEDSVSMIYEALSAGCQVGTLSVPGGRSGRVGSGLLKLAQQGVIITCQNYLQGQAMQPATGLDEAGRCAEFILQREWL